MANALYLYFKSSIKETEELVLLHQQNFDEYLNDLFTEAELTTFEGQLDAIAAIYVQPIFSELSFDDFYTSVEEASGQQEFFNSCKSSICLENLADFHTNPFQVSYVQQLLALFPECLIDRGGIEILLFKDVFILFLKSFKSVDSIISSPLEKPLQVKTNRPVFPIDFVLHDVYREIDRLKASRGLYKAIEEAKNLPDKTQVILNILLKDLLDSDALLRCTGLNPKDFGDNLERLKFWLKKLP